MFEKALCLVYTCFHRFAFAVLTLILIAGFAYGKDREAGEDQIKAAYLYKIAMFVNWPEGTFESASTPVEICVIGEDNLENSLLTAVAGKKINGRPFTIRHFKWITDFTTPCHILYVSKAYEGSMGEILRIIKSRNLRTLIIGDSENLAQKGAVISFYEENDTIRFMINADAAKISGLTISSKLWRLSKIIGESQGGQQ